MLLFFSLIGFCFCCCFFLSFFLQRASQRIFTPFTTRVPSCAGLRGGAHLLQFAEGFSVLPSRRLQHLGEEIRSTTLVVKDLRWFKSLWKMGETIVFSWCRTLQPSTELGMGQNLVFSQFQWLKHQQSSQQRLGVMPGFDPQSPHRNPDRNSGNLGNVWHISCGTWGQPMGFGGLECRFF